jgi:hypothetical protein
MIRRAVLPPEAIVVGIWLRLVVEDSNEERIGFVPILHYDERRKAKETRRGNIYVTFIL